MQNFNEIDVKRYFDETGPFDIIGDIHGCYEAFGMLMNKLRYEKRNGIYVHPQGRKIISVGDLNDRGPKNLEMIQVIIHMVEQNKGIYVYGNHCNKFYRYLLGRKVQIKHGLEDTVAEYEKLSQTERKNFKNRYIHFYESQSYYWILDQGNLVVCHAGILQRYIGKTSKRIHDFCIYGDVTGKTDAAGHPIRKDWSKEYTGQPLIVYGHTPILEPIIINNTVDIDQGCVFGGNLTALRYPEREFVSVPSNMPKDQEKYERMAKKYEDYQLFSSGLV